MKVSDARRDRQSIGAEHRRNVQVLSTILDNRNSAGGQRAGQWRIDDDFRWGLTAGERDNRGGATSVRCVLSGRVHFHLVRFKFAMLYPSMRSASGALLWLAGLQALSDRPALLQYRSRQTARNLGLWPQSRESDGDCGDDG